MIIFIHAIDTDICKFYFKKSCRLQITLMTCFNLFVRKPIGVKIEVEKKNYFS